MPRELKYVAGDKVRVRYLTSTFDVTIKGVVQGGYICACRSGDTRVSTDANIVGAATGEGRITDK
jgi:hypothetical protein